MPQAEELRKDPTQNRQNRVPTFLARELEKRSIRPLLTTKAAAEMLGKPVGTLKRWRGEGRGPAYVKLEGSVLYRVADLERYIESNVHLTSVRAEEA